MALPLCDLAASFVSEDEGKSNHLVADAASQIIMKIGAADSYIAHPDPDTPGLGCGRSSFTILELAWSGQKQRFHDSSRRGLLPVIGFGAMFAHEVFVEQNLRNGRRAGMNR